MRRERRTSEKGDTKRAVRRCIRLRGEDCAKVPSYVHSPIASRAFIPLLEREERQRKRDMAVHVPPHIDIEIRSGESRRRETITTRLTLLLSRPHHVCVNWVAIRKLLRLPRRYPRT